MNERDSVAGRRGMLHADAEKLIRECMEQAGINAEKQTEVQPLGWNLCHRVAQAAHKAGAEGMKAIIEKDEASVPNLDDVTIDQLAQTERILHALAQYANTKRLAMTYRANGRVDVAIHYERACDKTYKTLPPWARW